MRKYCLLITILWSVCGVSQSESEMLIPFLSNQKYGFSDQAGNIVIPPKYDLAYPFYPGHLLSMVVAKSKPFMINRRGKKVRNASSDYIVYNETVDFNQAYKFQPVEVALDSYCLSDSCPEFAIFNKLSNNSLIDKMGDLYFVKSQNKVVLIDSKGKVKTPEFDHIKHYVNPEIEYAITQDDNLKKYGLLNDKGAQILECVYDGIFYKGKGIFELTQSGQSYPYKLQYNSEYKPNELPQREINPNRIISRRDKKFGIADSNKNILLPYEYKKIYPLGDDFYLFWKENYVGIVKPGTGTVIEIMVKASVNGVIGNTDFIPYVPFTKNLAFLNDGEYWQLVNNKGETIVGNIEGIFVDFQKVAGNIAGLIVQGKVGVIDNTGKTILDFNFDKIYCIAYNNTFVAKVGNKWKWIDSTGKIIFDDFEDFKYHIEHYLFVNKFDCWFYVSDKGLVFRK